MHMYTLLKPLEQDGIEFVDIVEPNSGSIEFSKACATLANQFMYSQGKFVNSDYAKNLKNELPDPKPKKTKKDEVEEDDKGDVFESAKAMNQLYSMADPDFLVNMIDKFSAMYKRNPKIVEVNGEPMKSLHFQGLNHKDLSVLATAYCLAFMQG